MEYTMILLSAGRGVRFGKEVPKQYLAIAGKPMVVHTLENADKIQEIKEIIVVCNEEYFDTIKGYITNYNIHKKIKLTEGGATRQESVYKGLLVAEYDSVIIHEAARPFVSVEDYKKLIDCNCENVTYTYPIPYTVLKKNEDGFISDILKRDELVNIQLPQKFVKQDILKCHEKAIEDQQFFTEDAGMIKHYLDKDVYCLKGQAYNIKITEYFDLLFGEALYREIYMKENV